MAPDPDDYLKQAEALLHWAIDCETVAQKFRAAAADLIELARLTARSTSASQQQILPSTEVG
jgi:hypothetical protein